MHVPRFSPAIIAGAVTAALLLSAGAVFAHGVLQSSSPANGAHLTAAPRELRLTFSEAPELGIARIQLTGPDGQPVALGALGATGDRRMTLVAPIIGPLAEGPQTVAWQVAGADGHPVRGTFRFVISPGATGLGLAAGPTPATVPAPGDSSSAHHNPVSMPLSATEFDAESAGYVAVRWLLYASLLVVIGAVAFKTVVLSLLRGRKGVDPAQVEESSRRAARVGFAGACLLLAAVLARLIAQSIALHGSRGATDLELVGSMIAATTWGRAWLVQALAAVVALIGFRFARQIAGPSLTRAGWTVAALAALTLAFTPALASHAAASPRLRTLAIISDGLHVLGASGWLGSLLVLLVAGIPAALSLAADRRGAAVADLVNAFSPTALVFAGLVGATGVFAAWLHIGSIQGLWQSAYGELVLIKLGVLSLVALTGAYNWLRVRPALGGIDGADRIRRSATVEVAIATFVLVVTAILVATPTPMDM
jgi:putative copper export protein/methionine-rich copper-binding protein CopC